MARHTKTFVSFMWFFTCISELLQRNLKIAVTGLVESSHGLFCAFSLGKRKLLSPLCPSVTASVVFRGLTDCGDL